MNKEIEELIKAIQEAVPDIMKLEMGCKVRIEGQMNIYLEEDMFRNSETAEIDEYCLSPAGNDRDWYEILGRDITLEDCLIALNNNEPIQWLVEQLSDSENSRVSLFSVFTTTINPKMSKYYEGELEWNLGKSLHQQEQETIDFLYSLIVKQ